MSKWTDWMGWSTPKPPLTTQPLAGSYRPSVRFSSGYSPVGSDFASVEAFRLMAHGGGKLVTREEILAVPGFVSALDYYTSLATLPLRCYNGDSERIERKLLAQPESTLGFVRSITVSRTIEDLIMDGVCLWTVTDRDSTYYPTAVRRVPIGEWTQDADGTVRVGGDVVPRTDVILFQNSKKPWRQTAAGTVRAARLLQAAADKYSARPEMVGYFAPTDGVQPSDEEIAQFLADFEAQRQNGTVGMIPDGLSYNETKRMTAEELQLVQARQWIVSEITRVTSIESSWLSLPLNNNAYSNAQDARRDFISMKAAHLIHAIEERLSLGDVTPSTQVVKFGVEGYLRGNSQERANFYSTAITGGWMTVEEVRALEDLPPLTPEEGTND